MKKTVYIISMIVIDVVLILSSLWLAFVVRFDGAISIKYYKAINDQMPFFVLFALLSMFVFRLYHRLWRYASISELVSIFAAVTSYNFIMFLYGSSVNERLPISVYVLCWLFSLVAIGGSRFVLRLYLSYRRRLYNDKTIKVLIIGAGDAGAMIAREIINNYFTSKKLIGFIDDDEYKLNRNLFGVKVLGGSDNIAEVVRLYGVNEIIIAIPSAGGHVIKHILHTCKNLNCEVKTVPGIYELIDGKVNISQLRKVDVEDLLRRDAVRLDTGIITECLKDKKVLITGAGGSIGSEICRQVLKLAPKKLYILGRGENSIYEVESDLNLMGVGKDRIIPIIADIKDKEYINKIFAQYKPDVVFHAAAHKHVPLMERQPVEAVKNNIFGTKNVAEAALASNVERFVMISTDKAVNPSSVMGASKRIAELIIQDLNKHQKTKFTTVRFGNVLGSRGSVIPLFKKQIARGGPITLTSPDITRYFMTIPEAAQLVLQAGSMAEGGEVFVLDMGESIKIYDMACTLIELSGLRVNEDIKIEFIGLREGEKMYEELLTAEEGSSSTKHEKVFRANLKQVDSIRLNEYLKKLAILSTDEDIVAILAEMIPTYRPVRSKIKAEDIKQSNVV